MRINAWHLTLIVILVCGALGGYFYDPPPSPTSIPINAPPPDRVIIEAPNQ